jgi:hypothetical protein
MGLFDKMFRNKTGRSQKTTTSLGVKYVTEAKRTKSGSIKTTKRTTGRKK